MNTVDKIYIKLDSYYKLSWREQSRKLKQLRTRLYTLELENSLFENYLTSYDRAFLKGDKKGDISKADLDIIRQLVTYSGINLAIDRCLAYPHKVPRRSSKLSYGQKVQVVSSVNREIRRKLRTESLALKTEFNILESYISASQMQVKSITNKIKELDKILDSDVATTNAREYQVKLSRFLKENLQKLYQDWNKICLEANKVDSLRHLYSSGQDAVGVNDLKLKEVELKAVKEESGRINKDYLKLIKKKRATLKKLFSSRELLAKRTNDYEQVCKGINRLQPRIKSAYEIQYFVENHALKRYKQLAEQRKIKRLGFDVDDFLKKKMQLRRLEKKINGLKRRLRVKAKLMF